MNPKAQNHDIIVIGASAGGLRPLQELMSKLPAAVFVVVHIGASSHLAYLLDRVGALPVRRAASGEPIERGRVYVAAPDCHLLLHAGHVLLRRGPRENMARPAFDPLFRSAAASFGARVIGVVLSGALNDGTAGLAAIKRCGGAAVVQDPADAAVPEMPRIALSHVTVDHCVPSAAMADLLARLAAAPAGPTPPIPLEVRLEAAIAAQELADMQTEDRLGTPSRFSCPECHGTLWEVADGSLLRYRCHAGHAFTAEAMLAAQADAVDGLLSALLRSHQERAALARRLAEQERLENRDRLAAHFRARAREYERDAEVVQKLLHEHNDTLALKPADEGEARSPDDQEA